MTAHNGELANTPPTTETTAANPAAAGESLLPNNATPLERALDVALGNRTAHTIRAANPTPNAALTPNSPTAPANPTARAPTPPAPNAPEAPQEPQNPPTLANKHLWDSETCPAHLLPHLAWAFGVDMWDEGWSETTQRTAIAKAVAVHQKTGTISALRRALDGAGYDTARIYDRANALRYDGTYDYDGTAECMDVLPHWSDYALYMDRPVSLEQADQVRAMLKGVAPARARLAFIDYEQAHLYDGRARLNGVFTYGIV